MAIENIVAPNFAFSIGNQNIVWYYISKWNFLISGHRCHFLPYQESGRTVLFPAKFLRELRVDRASGSDGGRADLLSGGWRQLFGGRAAQARQQHQCLQRFQGCGSNINIEESKIVFLPSPCAKISSWCFNFVPQKDRATVCWWDELADPYHRLGGEVHEFLGRRRIFLGEAVGADPTAGVLLRSHPVPEGV